MGINVRNVKLAAFALGATFWRRSLYHVRRLPRLLYFTGILLVYGIHRHPYHGGTGRHGSHPGRDSGCYPVFTLLPEFLRFTANRCNKWYLANC